MKRSRILHLAVLLAAGSGAAQASGPAATLSREDALWLDRVTYGLDSTTVARFRELGKRRFLEEQLAGKNDALPAPVKAQVDQLDIAHDSAAKLVVDEIAEQKRINALGDEELKKTARKDRNDMGNKMAYEATRRELLRAIYSPDQLKEQLVWFWLNHFSVFSQKGYVRFLAGDYVDHSIRPYALGHFRDLVMATLKSPAMLQYLDNAQNGANHVNENYARELMELHTLGVGSGYTQGDVQELAKILTGVGIDPNHDDPKVRPALRHYLVREGLFTFNPERHDFGDRVLLGQKIKGGGFDEVERAVDLLVKQPACAQFVSRKLATYFVSDDPPPKLIEKMARTFQHSDGDIADVLRTMFESDEFAASLGRKFKDPMHYVVSSVRLAYDGKTITNMHPIVTWLNNQGQSMFGHSTPDGYALTENAWASSGQMSRRFEIARIIGNGNAGLFDAADGTKSADVGFPQLSSKLYYDGIQPYLSKTTLAALDKSASQQEWNAFLLSSPEFNTR
ncbi:MAG: DUF1800 domain-containing protein [Rudaea sp.]|uniref:DUF1800 domain-containing protein n=1 Tax=unclassified Rudaea TaxID=2627037 RepID=UPI0010F59403|nr:MULTISPECIES: DUF1800 domain-containing protein [unclassified Rudaea]MBN8885611.1 DUF1800 domain-containing protein [Rudaea sp.]